METESRFDEEIKISRYNSAALINLRINEILIDCNNHKRQGKFLSWNGDLDALWCELVGDVKKGEKEEEEYLKINYELSKLSPILNWDTYIEINEITEEDKQSHAKQYQKLLEKEEFLRRLQNEQGKGTAYKEPYQFT